MQTLDPFYIPHFMSGSLKSIHSEYDSLYISIRTDDDSKEVTIQTVEGDETRADSVSSENATLSSPSQQKGNENTGKMRLPPNEQSEKEMSSFVLSDNSPYITEELVLSSSGTAQNTHGCEMENSNNSENSTEMQLLLPTACVDQRAKSSLPIPVVSVDIGNDSGSSQPQRETQAREGVSAGYSISLADANRPIDFMSSDSGYIEYIDNFV